MLSRHARRRDGGEAVSEPQPMETAPRDGTMILVYWGTLIDAIHGDKTPLDGVALVYYDKSLDEEGWYVAHCNYYYPMILNPTGWMPAPTVKVRQP